MNYQQPHQAYQQNSIQTASPGELTMMLYNGCLKFIRLAKKGIENENIEQKNVNIQKAQNIINELMVTLNPEVEISNQMRPLYDYMNRQLIQANIKNDVEILSEVEGLVSEFRDTWKEVLKLNKQQKQVPVNG
ncbi:flagellar export chaperone FliS [Allobacillus sp. GCM10007491]|uniref:Flagellar secretion chaperone FliS n=2 Tax=Allobacillus TaxID=1400133 RepID=A0A941CUX9_9BACI|nr:MULTISPECIES: flagellar export chaperone FliS [Allobacillus]MBR7552690.1 flagellar export chaperone FliS [Allobacillus saliphilus]MBU6081458.1 flagellar export chaperone FliS [Allobacillus halotolerans]